MTQTTDTIGSRVHRMQLVGLLAATLSILMLFVPVVVSPILDAAASAWELFVFYNNGGVVYKLYIGGIISFILIFFCFINLFLYRNPRWQAMTSIGTLIVSLLLAGYVLYKWYTFQSNPKADMHPSLAYGVAIPFVIAILMILEFMESQRRIKLTVNP